MRLPAAGVRGVWLLAAAGIGWFAAASAVPGAQPAAKEPPSQSPPSETQADRDEMRERLARRIAELDSRSQMLKLAVQRLERGEDLESVREFIRDRGSIVGRLLADAEAPRELDRLEGRFPPRDGHGGPHGHGGPPVPGGPGGPGLGRGPDAGGPITEEERDVIREMLAVTDPAAWSSLQELREREPGEADKRIRRLLPMARVMLELRRRDPELYRLRLEQMRWDRQVVVLVGRVVVMEAAANTPRPELDRATKELREAGGRAFDMRIAIQAHELARVQERLSNLHAEIQDQQSKREELITHNIARLLDAARQRHYDDMHGGPRDDRSRPIGSRPGAGDDPAAGESQRRRLPRRDGGPR